MVDHQHANTKAVCKLFELSNNLIVTGIAVRLTAHLPNLLHSVNDNELGIWMLPHKILKLLIQSIPNLSGIGGKMQMLCIMNAIHHEHPALDTLKIILQREIQDGTGVYFIPPQCFACADVVGDLRHQKRLANLRRTCKDVCARIE